MLILIEAALTKNVCKSTVIDLNLCINAARIMRNHAWDEIEGIIGRRSRSHWWDDNRIRHALIRRNRTRKSIYPLSRKWTYNKKRHKNPFVAFSSIYADSTNVILFLDLIHTFCIKLTKASMNDEIEREYESAEALWRDVDDDERHVLERLSGSLQAVRWAAESVSCFEKMVGRSTNFSKAEGTARGEGWDVQM